MNKAKEDYKAHQTAERLLSNLTSYETELMGIDHPGDQCYHWLDWERQQKFINLNIFEV